MTRHIVVLVLLLSAAAFAQGPPPGPAWRAEAMTPDEDREARAFADAFSARMRETRDVSALVSDLFIPEFPAFFARVLPALTAAASSSICAASTSSIPPLRCRSGLARRGSRRCTCARQISGI